MEKRGVRGRSVCAADALAGSGGTPRTETPRAEGLRERGIEKEAISGSSESPTAPAGEFAGLAARSQKFAPPEG